MLNFCYHQCYLRSGAAVGECSPPSRCLLIFFIQVFLHRPAQPPRVHIHIFHPFPSIMSLTSELSPVSDPSPRRSRSQQRKDGTHTRGPEDPRRCLRRPRPSARRLFFFFLLLFLFFLLRSLGELSPTGQFVFLADLPLIFFHHLWTLSAPTTDSLSRKLRMGRPDDGLWGRSYFSHGAGPQRMALALAEDNF